LTSISSKYKTEAEEEQSEAIASLREELDEKSGKIRELNKATADTIPLCQFLALLPEFALSLALVFFSFPQSVFSGLLIVFPIP
jgi:hypothetical protein